MRNHSAVIDRLEAQLANVKSRFCSDSNNTHNQQRERKNRSLISNICMRLGDQYMKLDQTKKAEALYAEAHSIRLSIDGADHLRVARPLHDLALCWMSQRTTEGLCKAQRALQEVIRIRVQADGQCAAVDLASSFHDNGVVLTKLRRHGEAMESFRKALSIRIESFGESHAFVAETLTEIGKLYVALGDLGRARLFSEQALFIRCRLQQQRQRQRQDNSDPVFSSENSHAAAA